MASDPIDPKHFIEKTLPEIAARASERMAGFTSVGCIVFRVPEVGEWSLRVASGRLEVSSVVEDDALLQVTVGSGDFGPLVADSVERASSAERSMTGGALRALSLDARTARGLRHMPGTVAFIVRDGDTERRLLLSPGKRPGDMASPDCTVSCDMSDYVAVQMGTAQPMQLFADGRLRLSGNVQLALALAGLLA